MKQATPSYARSSPISTPRPSTSRSIIAFLTPSKSSKTRREDTRAPQLPSILPQRACAQATVVERTWTSSELDVRCEGEKGSMYDVDQDDLPPYYSTVGSHRLAAIEEDLEVVEVDQHEKAESHNMVNSKSTKTDFSRGSREEMKLAEKRRELLEEDKAISEALKLMGF